jgi:predicted branched-subunit amino acid permease
MSDVYDWRGFRAGSRTAFGAAGLVMAASFVGFGALLKSLGFGLLHGALTVPLMWALPGQVVYVDGVAKGLGAFAIFAGVTITAVRLLPMTVLVLSKARLPGGPRWLDFLLAHFTALTMWVLADQAIDGIERRQRLPWLLGLGSTLMAFMTGFAVIGYELAGRLPPSISAALVFMTPAFFFLSLFANSKRRADYLAIVLGLALGPAIYSVAPQFDLALAGLLGGTAAYFIGRRDERR